MSEKVPPLPRSATPRRPGGVLPGLGVRLDWSHSWVMAALALLVLPLVLRDDFLLSALVFTLLYAYVGSAWNIIAGYGGQLSLGHGVFFGLGAYTSTLMFARLGVSPWLGMLVGAGLSAALAALISYPCFRLRGPFFSLATIGFIEVARSIAIYWRDLTKGNVGLFVSFRPGLENFMFEGKLPWVYTAMFLLFLGVGVSFLVQRSRLGYYLTAIREDEDSAEAAGIDTTRYKLLGMVISAALTSFGGTFYAQYVSFIDPDSVFSTDLSVQFAIMPIIGGVGTLFGPVAGAFVVMPVSEALRALLGGRFGAIRLIIYGTVLIVMVLLMPQGIVSALRRRFQRSRPSSGKPTVAEVPDHA